MIYIIFIVMLIFAVFYIVYPFSSGKTPVYSLKVADERKEDQLKFRISAIKSSLRDLNTEKSIRKISEEDYQKIKNELVYDWNQLENELQHTAEKNTPSIDDTKCSGCGKELQQREKISFCPYCGKQLKDMATTHEN